MPATSFPHAAPAISQRAAIRGKNGCSAERRTRPPQLLRQPHLPVRPHSERFGNPICSGGIKFYAFQPLSHEAVVAASSNSPFSNNTDLGAQLSYRDAPHSVLPTPFGNGGAWVFGLDHPTINGRTTDNRSNEACACRSCMFWEISCIKCDGHRV